uniref:Sugar transporter n=1 Tax=Nilaparvata lugens TaxID=108931 RepID=A0A0A8J7G8_NILLU|nr:sugar transporter [Nilaparvata lugens]
MIQKGLFNNRVLRQYTAGFICSLSVMAIGCSIGWTSPAIPKLRSGSTRIQLSDVEITWVVAVTYIANIISPVPSGWLMDRIGRKHTLIASNVLTIGSWFVLLYATCPLHLYIGRFMVGLMFGVGYTVVPVYLAEISEARVRGSVSSLMSVMIYVGTNLEYCVGPYVSYDILCMVSVTVPILFACTFAWIPESPYYFVIKGNTDAAKKSLSWLRCDMGQRDMDAEFEKIKSTTELQMKDGGGKFKDLIATKGNRRALLIAEILAIIQRFSGIGPLIAYSSITIPEKSIPGITRNEQMIVLGMTWLFTSIFASFLSDKLGRKVLLAISCTGCGIACLSASTWFYLREKTSTDVTEVSWIPFVAFIFHALFYSLGLGPIALSIKGEMFPANVKAKASAVTTMVLAVNSFWLNKTYLIIADTFGFYVNFMIYGVTMLLALIFIWFFVVETRRKTLQEIQERLEGGGKRKKVEEERGVEKVGESCVVN